MKQVATNTPNTLIVISQHCFPLEETRAPCRNKYLIPGLWQEMYKMNLSSLVPQSKKVIKN